MRHPGQPADIMQAGRTPPRIVIVTNMQADHGNILPHHRWAATNAMWQSTP
jgi:hypothetical protein